MLFQFYGRLLPTASLYLPMEVWREFNAKIIKREEWCESNPNDGIQYEEPDEGEDVNLIEWEEIKWEAGRRNGSVH